MVSNAVFLLIVLLGFTLMLSFPIKHPTCRALVSFALAVAITAPVYVDVRLAVVGTIIGGAVLGVSRSVRTLPVLIVHMALAVLLLFYPHANYQLYLETRYTDDFPYLTEGLYYSRNLDKSFDVSLKYGDTYQSALYEDLIVKEVFSLVPSKCTIRRIMVEPVQTRHLYYDAYEYIKAVHPTVYLDIAIPDDYEFRGIRTNYFNIILERVI